MLHKLEDLYLAILRFVVILVAGLLLVGVIVLGLNSFRSLQPAPIASRLTPSVSEEALRNSLNLLLKKNAFATQQSTSATEETQKLDPNQSFYDRTAVAIVAFMKEESGGDWVSYKARAAQIAKARAEKYSTPELTAAHAKNFAETMERMLKDPSLLAAAKEVPRIDLLNRLVETFTDEFDQQIKTTESQNQARQQEYLEKKAEGQQSLYIAGGAFAAFLMIVFLSIIIRIERNLRYLERPSA